MKKVLVSAPVGVLVAIAAGICFYLAFSPIGIGALAAIGVLLLTMANYRASFRRGFGLALLTGFTFFYRSSLGCRPQALTPGCS